MYFQYLKQNKSAEVLSYTFAPINFIDWQTH